jgi:hypothetical protein
MVGELGFVSCVATHHVKMLYDCAAVWTHHPGRLFGQLATVVFLRAILCMPLDVSTALRSSSRTTGQLFVGLPPVPAVRRRSPSCDPSTFTCLDVHSPVPAVRRRSSSCDPSTFGCLDVRSPARPFGSPKLFCSLKRHQVPPNYDSYRP